MNKIIIKKCENNFSYFKYFLFTYLKKYKIYDKYIEENIFYLPYKKRLNKAYLKALVEYMKLKNISTFLSFDEDIKKEFKKHFSTINIKNIYNTIFIDMLNFYTKNKIHEYEIIFVSDNIKEVKNLIKMCVKKVKAVSVLTNKPFLYESMKDYVLSKYGLNLNVKSKKEKLKKHNKIYINCGYNRTFDKNTFSNVNMIDVYKVYENVFNTIIFETSDKEKKYTKKLKCPYSLELAAFLYEEEDNKEYKIVSIKK